MNCSVWDVISGEVEMLQKGLQQRENNKQLQEQGQRQQGSFRSIPFHSNSNPSLKDLVRQGCVTPAQSVLMRVGQ